MRGIGYEPGLLPVRFPHSRHQFIDCSLQTGKLSVSCVQFLIIFRRAKHIDGALQLLITLFDFAVHITQLESRIRELLQRS